MELSFENKIVRSICEDDDSARLQYGPSLTLVLQSRLADLDAANSVNDLIVGNPAEILNESHSYFKIDLCEEFQLVFCANNIKIPLKDNKQIDWSKVTRIKILKIEQR